MGRKSKQKGGLDKRWFQSRLAEVGKTQTQLSARLNIHKSQVSNLFSGKRQFQLHELPIVAEFLEVTVETVASRAGIHWLKQDRLMVKEQVATGTSTVEELPGDTEYDQVVAPPGLTDARAAVVRGNGMAPRFRDGEIIVYGNIEKLHPETRAGCEVVAQLVGGPRVLGVLHLGARWHRYTIAPLNPLIAPHTDVEIEWVAEVVWHHPVPRINSHPHKT